MSNEICKEHSLLRCSSCTEIESLTKELEITKRQLEESLRVIESFNEYREATDRNETSKSNTKWHTYERILYDSAKIFLNKLKNEKEAK